MSLKWGWELILLNEMQSTLKGDFDASIQSLCASPVHSRVEALCQTSYGPDNYTLGWEVRNTSTSISKFRVYHEGALHGTTSLTNYTVAGLLPCEQYEAKVEALCGDDDVVMHVQTVPVHTGNGNLVALVVSVNDAFGVKMLFPS